MSSTAIRDCRPEQISPANQFYQKHFEPELSQFIRLIQPPPLVNNALMKRQSTINAGDEVAAKAKMHRDKVLRNKAFTSSEVFDKTSLSNCPWIRDNGYPPTTTGLSEEICDFEKWANPTESEQKMRLCVINRLKENVNELWPSAVLKVFGSIRTGLFLPSSDIDMAIYPESPDVPASILIEQLKVHIISSGLSEAEECYSYPSASVPLVKYVDSASKCVVDVSFNTPNIDKAAACAIGFLRRFPFLRSLVLITKQFLVERDLNEVYKGGLSSCSLLYLWVSYFQTHPRSLLYREMLKNGLEITQNLGVILLEFFELYGCLFNYKDVGIRITCNGSLVEKPKLMMGITQQRHNAYREGKFKASDSLVIGGTATGGENSLTLCVEDPINPANDVSRGSYNIYGVQQAFNNAYINLQAIVFGDKSFLTANNVDTLLGRIIRINDDVVKYRKLTKINYESREGCAAEFSALGSDEPTLADIDFELNERVFPPPKELEETQADGNENEKPSQKSNGISPNAANGGGATSLTQRVAER